jgi:hypothetical protein
VILDNLAVHKTPAVKAWAAIHPEVQFHFTPTYSSWLNQVEIWLGMITRDCIRRGIFHSLPHLSHPIMNYIRLYNRTAQPFRWTYSNPKKRIRVSPFFGNTTLALQSVGRLRQPAVENYSGKR